MSGFVNAQIGINNPTPYSVCEVQPNSNVALFYLPFKNYEIFGALNPNNYTIEYYSDSDMTMPISTPYSSSNTTIYIKVIDNSNPSISQNTSLDLIVKSKPQVSVTVTQPTCNSESSVFFSGLPSGNWFLRINGSNSLLSYNTPTHLISNVAPGDYTYEIISSGFCYSDPYSVTITAPVGVPIVSLPPELHHYENPFDGIMSFNLTSHQNNIIGNQTGINLIYYTSNTDAQNDTNAIANPTAYQNLTNPQTIWVRAVNTSTNCYQITDFKIKAFDSSTIVNIPDSNFKARLLSANYTNHIAFVQIGGNGSYGQIDINLDGEIQNTEALNVNELNVNSALTTQKISSLAGIEAFTNISNLNCSSNLLTDLNITNLINNYLWSLDCSYNNLPTFNYNSLGNNLSVLNCSGNNISNLNISNLLGLTDLNCSNNQLSALEIAPFHLQKLNCSINQISTLNFGYPQEMINLDVSQNLLTNLNLASFSSSLTYLRCDGNTISNLDFSNVNPTQVSCGPVSTPIQIENCTNLQYFRLIDTQQGSINFNNLVNLNDVYFWNTNIEEIDLSNATNLNDFSVVNAQDLTYINLKNGQTWSGTIGNFYSYPIQVSNCPSLLFICADENNISNLNTVLNYYSVQNVQINSYCSFTPGGDYNTITGAMIFDANTNGCDALDLPQPNIKININDGTAQGSTFTNNSGNYNFYTETGSFVVTPSVENASYFTFSPTTATVPFANDNNNIVTQNFCITANGVHPDLEIVIAPIVPARPGFDAVYQIVYKNKGNQTLSQLYGVNFFFNQNLMDFVSATTTPSTVGPGSLSWSYTNLLPFESRSIYVTVNINTPTDTTNPVNIGDILQFTTSILPMAGDESTVDNTFLFNQTVVGSFDPNNIICMEGTVVSPSEIGDYLHYVINFENTGTSEAENIVVQTDVNVNDFDISSLQMLATSHNAYIKVVNNQVEFIFQNIMLETGGHGNVLLKIRSKSNLVTGDVVSKKADIFFDYNFPIDTGMANTTFQALSTGEFVSDNSINVYPNPAANFVTINSDSTINSIQLYDVQGRLLQTKIENNAEVTFDISNQSNGIYFFKIQSDNGVKVVKLIKE
ncbi:hypothetical protein FAQ01_03070 [Flavobacterium aquatile]|nr:hypothetical protein FAQ01_03070 [Flavobacterium aquatile]